MKISSILVATLVAMGSFCLWALVNQPTQVASWPAKVSGFAFSPFRPGQSALLDEFPSLEQIREDLALLAPQTRALRTYSSRGTIGAVPALAEEFGLDVALGIWLDGDAAKNEQEVLAGIELANWHNNVTSVVVGNEVFLRDEFSLEDLGKLLDRVREAVDQPVSTAEPWNTWLEHPELADHVDFIMVHLLPYWEGVALEESLAYLEDKLRRLELAFPDKPIVIGEVGWPSEGRTRGDARASLADQALFLRGFLDRAEQLEYPFFLMEAFDQPWKARNEGGVGAYWGVYDVSRRAKFPFVEPVVRVPEWQILAAVSILTTMIMLLGFFAYSETLRAKGHGLLALVASGAATVIVWIVYDYSQQYFTLTSAIVGVLLMAGMLGVVVILLTEAHEWAEAHWFTVRRRQLNPALELPAVMPRVSIHVPAYNEPAAMMIETLNALARLDYPDFEVLVIDNNTRDEAVWRPVEAHCRKLGERFRFFHVSPLPGFKAGALNFALSRTARDASIVAVIDSDYQVEPNWLRDLIPAFNNSRVAIVQAPQDYRDQQENAFKSMCHAEYRGFFEIGMVTRNERNAIIQHGTMTIVRRDVLEEVGGWGEWCITEDAELGLRIFEAGYEALYLPYSYGQGLIPDTFVDYKKQRFRWAYGAMQILRHHASQLFDPQLSTLSRGQRYHFLAGWLPWIADGFNLVFNMAAIAWSLAMLLNPTQVDAPLLMFAVLPLSLFIFKLAKIIYLYRSRVKANLRQTLAAAFAGLALSHTVGLATLKGLFTDNQPFVRTPKCARPSAVRQALLDVREEILLLGCLLGVSLLLVLIPREFGSPDLTVWSLVLAIQSLPYAAAVAMSFISAFRLPSSLLGQAIRRHGLRPPRGKTA